ncbi:MAG: Sm ribonucleo [Hyperthermus sp.]|nr:MAG: Sm ribonucleo [Hyperthermus sp.]
MLKEAVGRVILVKLKDGSEYIGKLEVTDSTMNLVLDGCVEVKPGTLEPRVKYGRALIRGSHVVYVSIDYEIVARGSLPL